MCPAILNLQEQSQKLKRLTMQQKSEAHQSLTDSDRFKSFLKEGGNPSNHSAGRGRRERWFVKVTQLALGSGTYRRIELKLVVEKSDSSHTVVLLNLQEQSHKRKKRALQRKSEARNRTDCDRLQRSLGCACV